MLEQRGERLPDAVDLVAAVKADVLPRDFAVQRQITCCPGWSHTETLDQVGATDLTEEVEPKIDVGQPLPQSVAQGLDALWGHVWLLLTQGL